jgi:hypothetical protein
MDQVLANISAMRAQGAKVATELKAMGYTIVMGAWMPRVNNTINILKSSIDTVMARVTQLETHQTPAAV